MSWIKDLISPKTRQWEEFYRNRYQHDKVVRSTHGVNCTGGCSWNIHVKDGIVVWETQAMDYPLLEKSLPPYEPRGCQPIQAINVELYQSALSATSVFSPHISVKEFGRSQYQS